MNRALLVAVILGAAAAARVPGQQPGNSGRADRRVEPRPSAFSLRLDPALEIPFGESSDYFKLGGSLELAGEYSFTESPAWFVSVGLGYQLAPIQAESSVQLLSGGIGTGLSLDLMPRLSARASVAGGCFFGLLPTESGLESGGNPFLKAGVGLSFLLSPRVSLGLGAAYHNLLGLYQGLGVSAGASVYLSGLERREARFRSGAPAVPGTRVPGPGEGIRIESLDFVQVFPVFQTYYDDHPIGWVGLLNQEKEPVQDVKVSLFIREYMHTPKLCAEIEALQGQEQRRVELNALFTDSILSVTEGTKVAAEITLEYRLQGELYQATRSETVRLYDRNALTWDDDRKACAFVTAKDPTILGFARNVVGAIRGTTKATVSEELLKAMALHEALNLYGLQYVVDPQTPYATFSKEKAGVDFLQFPRQTLEYRSGDCDDLSILYSALLEAVGVESAFITVPGHIFTAFRAQIEPDKARRSFLRTDELIFLNEQVWIPVEVTDRGGFLEAWGNGSRQWRQHAAGGQARLIAMHTAWDTYEPVALPGEGRPAAVPEAARVLQAFQQELARFIDREIHPQAASLEKAIQSEGASATLQNRLGVLYARYGLLDQAEAAFRKAVAREEFAPALVNLGNICYLREQWQQALQFYERASRRAPEDPLVLLPIARVHHKLENYGLARTVYLELKNADPQLAGRYAYLEQRGEAGVRAAEAARVEGVVEWNEH